jgi:hypothetical protein
VPPSPHLFFSTEHSVSNPTAPPVAQNAATDFTDRTDTAIESQFNSLSDPWDP